MTEVMTELDEAREELLDQDDDLVGRVKNVKEVELGVSRMSRKWRSH